ncbi:ribosomal protein L27, putative, partial [Ixodes scapularis]
CTSTLCQSTDSRAGGPQWQAVRGATKGNRACRQDGPQRGHRYGWRKWSGQRVHEGELLVKQRTLRFHPGLNVVFGYRHSLLAAVEGRVAVTFEKVNPCWDNPRVQSFYEGRDVSSLHKKYYHVIPDPQENKFRLVSLV